MKQIHLLSNAHLDPVWQWQWEEGAAEAISTFRAAADFCEEFDGYIFNHNEVILYKWVEEYEPDLFARIQRLVALGKWNIMGGWYLQPDCNMPSGESIVRQILTGKTYFRDKFGVEPTTAINFDSFGHTRGLVQILQQAGYDSYIFMRPDEFNRLPSHEFIWKGFNDSQVTAHKIQNGYGTFKGEAREKTERWIAANPDAPIGLVLWGVGNHGGGPSRIDIRKIAELQKERTDYEIVHSTPERYFQQLPKVKELPSFEGDLNPRFIGCYTSMIRVKQQHRLLENELYMTEKMLAAASMRNLIRYPSDELQPALYDLMISQFHDILPGTAIQKAEEDSLRIVQHGLEITTRLRARAFFALASGQPKAAPGHYPILIYNPHPYAVRGTFECEFMLADQNWDANLFSRPVVYKDGQALSSQPEKELSNLNLDWRKRIVFEAELAPSSMNRFDCVTELIERSKLPAKPSPVDGKLAFVTDQLSVIINTRTGLMDEYKVNGVSYLLPGAFAPLLLADNEDSWRMDTDFFRTVIDRFTLMEPGESSDFSGVRDALLPAVRVIEDGEVRTVVEAVLKCRGSSICLTYKLPKRGTEVEIQVRVYWNEKDKLLKLSVPTCMQDGLYRGQTAFGISSLPADGTEAVAQKWVAVQSRDNETALTCINDGIYGSDFYEGEMRLSLLRSPAYCAHPILDRTILEQDRFHPRMDQGEHGYTFWINAGTGTSRMAAIEREALTHNEKPYALSFFPSGNGIMPASQLELEDEVIQMSAFKKEENGEGYIIRIYEPTGQARETTIVLPQLGIRHAVKLNGFEFKTFRLDATSKSITEVTLGETRTLLEQ